MSHQSFVQRCLRFKPSVRDGDQHFLPLLFLFSLLASLISLVSSVSSLSSFLFPSLCIRSSPLFTCRVFAHFIFAALLFFFASLLFPSPGISSMLCASLFVSSHLSSSLLFSCLRIFLCSSFLISAHLVPSHCESTNISQRHVKNKKSSWIQRFWTPWGLRVLESDSWPRFTKNCGRAVSKIFVVACASFASAVHMLVPFPPRDGETWSCPRRAQRTVLLLRASSPSDIPTCPPSSLICMFA